MAIEIRKVMEKDEKGIDRQIYPETHIDAVIGIGESENSQSTQKFLNSLPLADTSQNGLMSSDNVKKLNELKEKFDRGEVESKNNILTDKVGEVDQSDTVTDIATLNKDGKVFYPQTHADAILDLDKHTGNATLTFQVGTVASTDGAAKVVNSGTGTDIILDFDLPKGLQGEKGDTALTLAIGRVKTVESNEPATVTNVGTDSNLIFDFSIPKGEIGEAGKDGTAVPLASNQTDGLMSSKDKAYIEDLRKNYFEKVGEV